MSVNSETLSADEHILPEISHRRILVEMAIILVAAILSGFVFISAKVGFGILIGGALAFVNYFWQRNSLKAIFDRAIGGQGSRFLAARYILRYVVIGLVLGLIYLSGAVSIYGVIFGLASFAIAVVIEGFSNIILSTTKES